LIERAAAPHFGIKAYGGCCSFKGFRSRSSLHAFFSVDCASLVCLQACMSMGTSRFQMAAKSSGWRGAARQSRPGKCPCFVPGPVDPHSCAG
jgi:hypothetical protein